MMLKWDFLVLNDALMRFFGVKQYLNEIFLLKQYSNEIKSLRFVYNRSAPLISFIFYLNRENLARTVQDINGMRWKKWWMKWNFNRAIFPKTWVSLMPA